MSESTPSTRRFRLTIAYDGRPYRGWQSQAGGETVQDVVLATCRSICPEASTVQGAGRTDAGVSAEGQVAHFDVPAGWSMEAEHWFRALNTKLPATIRVMECAEAPPTFHSRFSRGEKVYRYRIFTGPVLPPLLAGLAWHRRHAIPMDEIAEWIRVFEGRHDFKAFSSKRRDGHEGPRDTFRTIHATAVSSDAPHQLDLRFRGSGFLYKMVRFLVGSAVYGIQGKLDLEEIRDLLADPASGRKAPCCAPPDGLTLERVIYETD